MLIRFVLFRERDVRTSKDVTPLALKGFGLDPRA
jgi:hypothetical protein